MQPVRPSCGWGRGQAAGFSQHIHPAGPIQGKPGGRGGGGGAAGKNVKSGAVSCPWRKQVESVTLEPGQRRGEQGAGMLRKEVEEMVQLTLKRCFNPHGTTDHTLRADS